MHTSSEHIIIHFQIINGKNYLRIITVSNTDDYIQEIKTVYDQNISIHDGSISAFYNCGELYDRLISDLGFKKFKGVNKITKILNGLWQIDQNEGTIDIMGWYINTYIAWIKSRLNMYIEDLDDDQYFYPWDVKWCDFVVKDYVKIQYLEDLKNTNYRLQDCEKTKEGNFIFTRNHFLALISHYINNNYGKVLAPFEIKEMSVKLPTEVDENVEKSTLIINKCDYLRGLTLDKNVLSTIDVEEIFKILLIPNMVLGSIAKSKDFISTYQDEITNQFNNLCESNLFGGFYSFLEESKGLQPNCQGDINNAYGILEKDTYDTSSNPRDLPLPAISGPAKPRSIINIDSSNFMNDLIKKAVPATLANIMLLGPIQTENIVQPIEQTKMLFKNLITNIVHAYNTNIKLLKELELLSSYTYKNEFTSKVIESLEEISLSRPLINELKELISILDNVTGEDDDDDIDKISTNKSSEFNIQRLLTDSYVKTYKNDKAETVASTVIDNVYNYLSPLKPINEQINRNQIGRDLVDLGVKKTRKAKGFVYGIEDTGHVEKKPMTSADLLPKEGLWSDLKTTPKELTVTFSDFKIDESKVIKNNKQIRSEPPVAVDNQLFKFSAPSKFLDKVSKEHSQSLPKDQIGW
jgi:hypothetical protein